MAVPELLIARAHGPRWSVSCTTQLSRSRSALTVCSLEIGTFCWNDL